MSATTLYNANIHTMSQYGSPMPTATGTDRGALLNGLRTSPRTPSVSQMQYQQQQQQQQQLQVAQMQAMYQQQQYDLAQQQAALELQLQLEQFRLQNLALQEQIMRGQVAQAQAQAEAEAALQQRLGERNVYTAPLKSAALIGSRGFAAAQGGVLAERALARRNLQQEQQQTPVHQQVYRGHHHRRQSSTGSYLSSSTSHHDPNAPTPALILSKPGEAFPISSPASMSVVSHKHSDSDGSSASSAQSSLDAFLSSRGQGSDESFVDSPASEITSFANSMSVNANPSVPVKGTAEDAWKPEATSPPSNNETGSPKPKLNPFSSVFVPASMSHSATAAPSVAAPAPVLVAPAVRGVYRAPRSGSPPSGTSSPLGRLAGGTRLSPTATGTAAVFALATRQPKGPPSHAEEIESQNFNSRLRKRAIGAIRNLNLVPRSPTAPSVAQFGSVALPFEWQQQQQVQYSVPSHMQPMQMTPGLAALMQATRTREEMAWKAGDVSF